MNFYQTLLIAISCSLSSSIALAGSTTPFKPFKPANAASSGTGTSYIGASLGSTTLSDGCENIACEDGNQAWKIYGGYEIGGQVILEGGYVSLGELKGNDTTAKTAGFTASTLAYIPVNEQINIFGKAGFFKWENEITQSDQKITTDDTSALVGFGANYKISNNLNVRAEWEQYKDIIMDEDESKTNLNTLSMGLTFSSF
jgi:opacity protein-like surface antigen